MASSGLFILTELLGDKKRRRLKRREETAACGQLSNSVLGKKKKAWIYVRKSPQMDTNTRVNDLGRLYILCKNMCVGIVYR